MYSTRRIAIGLVVVWPLGLFWLLRRLRFRLAVAIGVPALLVVVAIGVMAILAGSRSSPGDGVLAEAKVVRRPLACGALRAKNLRETFVVTTTKRSCGRARADARVLFKPPYDVSGWATNCLQVKFARNELVRACPSPTASETHAHRLALARAARIAHAKALAAARAAQQQARDEARAHAAYVAAANAWHSGYDVFDSVQGVYFRWRDDLSCASYETYCWRIEVITRGGCSSLFVEANELDTSGTIIGDLIDSRDNVPPKTPALLELDGTSGSTSSRAHISAITCNTY